MKWRCFAAAGSWHAGFKSVSCCAVPCCAQSSMSCYALLCCAQGRTASDIMTAASPTGVIMSCNSLQLKHACEMLSAVAVTCHAEPFCAQCSSHQGTQARLSATDKHTRLSGRGQGGCGHNAACRPADVEKCTAVDCQHSRVMCTRRHVQGSMVTPCASTC